MYSHSVDRHKGKGQDVSRRVVDVHAIGYNINILIVARGPAQIIHESPDDFEDNAALEDESLSLIPAVDHFGI